MPLWGLLVALGTTLPAVAGASAAANDSPEQVLQAAYAAREAGRFDEAVQLFAQVMAQAPTTAQGAEAGLMVAFARRAEGRLMEAAELFRQVAAHPRATVDVAAEAYLMTAWLWLDCTSAQATTTPDGHGIVAPDAADTAAVRAGYHDTARQALERVVAELAAREAPICQALAALAAYGVGVAYLRLDVPLRAEVWFRRVLTMDPSMLPEIWAVAHYGLGQALARQGRDPEAAEQFQQVLEWGTAGPALRGLTVEPALQAEARRARRRLSAGPRPMPASG